MNAFVSDVLMMAREYAALRSLLYQEM